MKTAVVTGGSRGIGLGVASALCAQGFYVYILSRSPPNLSPLSSASSSASTSAQVLSPNTFHHISCDVSNVESLEQAAKKVIEKDGKTLEVLVNCAGINLDSLLLRASPASVDQLLQTNLYGSIHSSRLFLRPMMKLKKGAFVPLALTSSPATVSSSDFLLTFNCSSFIRETHFRLDHQHGEYSWEERKGWPIYLCRFQGCTGGIYQIPGAGTCSI